MKCCVLQALLLDEMQMMETQCQELMDSKTQGSHRAKSIMLALGRFHEEGLGLQHQIGLMTVAAGTQVPQLDSMLPTEYLPCRCFCLAMLLITEFHACGVALQLAVLISAVFCHCHLSNEVMYCLMHTYIALDTCTHVSQ